MDGIGYNDSWLLSKTTEKLYHFTLTTPPLSVCVLGGFGHWGMGWGLLNFQRRKAKFNTSPIPRRSLMYGISTCLCNRFQPKVSQYSSPIHQTNIQTTPEKVWLDPRNIYLPNTEPQEVWLDVYGQHLGMIYKQILSWPANPAPKLLGLSDNQNQKVFKSPSYSSNSEKKGAAFGRFGYLSLFGHEKGMRRSYNVNPKKNHMRKGRSTPYIGDDMIMGICKHINPYCKPDDHPLPQGTNGSLDPNTYQGHSYKIATSC